MVPSSGLLGLHKDHRPGQGQRTGSNSGGLSAAPCWVPRPGLEVVHRHPSHSNCRERVANRLGTECANP